MTVFIRSISEHYKLKNLLAKVEKRLTFLSLPIFQPRANDPLFIILKYNKKRAFITQNARGSHWKRHQITVVLHNFFSRIPTKIYMLALLSTLHLFEAT